MARAVTRNLLLGGGDTVLGVLLNDYKSTYYTYEYVYSNRKIITNFIQILTILLILCRQGFEINFCFEPHRGQKFVFHNLLYFIEWNVKNCFVKLI